MAGLLGRQSLGGTDVVLDMQAKEGDPACTIIGQHFATLGKLVASWPVEHKDHLEAAWATTWETLKQKQYPWKTAAGSARSSGRLPAQLRVASPVAEELEANKWTS